MPSFQDSAFIFFLALLLFGPKKLPELARQLGKLMGEFRRASNEFRMQMDDELRLAEQAENQKKIAAIEAAAPVAPALENGIENTIAAPVTDPIEDPMDLHPHTMIASEPVAAEPDVAAEPRVAAEPAVAVEAAVAAEPVPIASSGDLHMMPPSTGLPVGRSTASSSMSSPASSSVESVFAAIPEAPSETDETPHRSSEIGTMSRAETLPAASAEVPQHG